MSSITSLILPTLDSFGVWAYWIVGLFAFLESWWLTGVIAPGTLVVDAGGALVRLGHLDFLDLCWFVALGAVLGGEVGFATGRRVGGRWMRSGRTFDRAGDLVRRYGAFALVLGRFLGPVAGLAALAAALSGMERRRFRIWNILGALVYAPVHVALGYAVGDVLARIGPLLPRVGLPLLAFALLVLAIWFVTRQIRRGLPAFHAGATALGHRLAELGPVQGAARRHPRMAAFLRARLATGRGDGLMATGLAALLVYLLGLWVDGAIDLVLVPGTAETDLRVSRLMQSYWTPAGLRIAGWITQAGHVPVAALLACGAVAAFAISGRRAAAAGFAVATLGNAATVTLLKLAFGRNRPDFAVFEESSHSFPSGHAAISVALFGTLFVLAWRERLIGPTMALVGAVTAAIAIGGTRVYLAEHFLSDVLNGWTVGAIWMVIGIATAEILRQRLSGGRRSAGAAAVIFAVALAGALWVAVADPPSEAPPVPSAPGEIADLSAALGTADLPVAVKTLDGTDLPPVALVTAGPPLADMARRLGDRGWHRVPGIGIASILAAIRSDLTGRLSTGATAPPAFRAGRPSSMAFRTPDLGAIVRAWDAGRTSDGAPLTAWAIAPSAEPEGVWRPDGVRRRLAADLGASDPTTTRLDPARGVLPDEAGRWATDGRVMVVLSRE